MQPGFPGPTTHRLCSLEQATNLALKQWRAQLCPPAGWPGRTKQDVPVKASSIGPAPGRCVPLSRKALNARRHLSGWGSERMCVGRCPQRPDAVPPGPAQGVAQRSPWPGAGLGAGETAGRVRHAPRGTRPPGFSSTRFICFLGRSQARPLPWIQRHFSGWGVSRRCPRTSHHRAPACSPQCLHRHPLAHLHLCGGKNAAPAGRLRGSGAGPRRQLFIVGDVTLK